MIDFQGLHYLAGAVPVVLAGFGVPLGISAAAKGLSEGLLRQQSSFQENFNTLIIGTLMIESSLALAFIAASVTLFAPPYILTLPVVLAELGGALAIGVSAFLVAFSIGAAVKASCISVSRQPFHIHSIRIFMFVLMTLIETPVFFAFLIWLFIRTKVDDIQTLGEGIKLCAAGVAMAVGSIGPSIGQKIFVRKACLAVGCNKEAYGGLFTLSMITEAMIETPVLLTFIVSSLMIVRDVSPIIVDSNAIVFFAVACAMGLGTLGASIGIGIIGSKATRNVALNSEAYGSILGTTFIAQAFAETSSLFAFLIALLIVLKTTVWKV
ncbi:ATP synthase F0 subunit C [Candidatus Babeliales bacterium]|nr:ATP synthase F0 subunit C [Candidatus Babeliales bacterium]